MLHSDFLKIWIKNCFSFLFLFFSFLNINAQQTVGVFQNNPLSLNGYTLFGNNEITYLIDNCGFKVNTWESNYDPGLSMYLLENGNLLRTARISGNFSGGGLGGRFELFNWEGDLLWSYEMANGNIHAHHDIEPLPNGNFLAILWEKYSGSEAQDAGRMSNQTVWSEKIVEIEIVGSNQANIVWEWRLWDHLIQDFDNSKMNFGTVSEHPELVNINFIAADEEDEEDWIHANAIAYNEALDQIAISSRNFNEIWIIDHSTSTAQAASHNGGNQGKGGDLLYRFGNPQTYNRGNSTDQIFFNQHDIRWIPEGSPEAGKLMVFNNENAANASSVEIWSPPIDNQGFYIIPDNEAFGPSTVDYEFSTPGFYSDIMSSAQMLSNGNLFICEGASGRFFEITAQEDIVWEYINPVNRNGGPTAQSGTVHFNQVFRATRYPANYAGFDGKDLSPGTPVEINPWDLGCEIFDNPEVGVENLSFESSIKILGNPMQEFLILESAIERGSGQIFDAVGNLVKEFRIGKGRSGIDISKENSGIYFLKIEKMEGQVYWETVVKF